MYFYEYLEWDSISSTATIIIRPKIPQLQMQLAETAESCFL